MDGTFFSGCLQDMQGMQAECTGLNWKLGLRKIQRLIFFSSIWRLEKKKKMRLMERSTFACFDLPRFDFFLLMMVLNQSPDPMACSNRSLPSGDQFVFKSLCLDHMENKRKSISHPCLVCFVGGTQKIHSTRWCNMA